MGNRLLLRETNIDLLRILSIFAVIIIHTNAYFYNDGYGIPAGVITEVINFCNRFCVPCFIMISGAFALKNKNTDNWISYYRRRFVQVVVPYLLIAGLWLAYYALFPIDGETLFGSICHVFCGEYGNLWFMPTIILLYLITPYIQMIKATATKKQWCEGAMGLMLWAMVSATPVGKSYSLGNVGNYLAFYILGDVIYSFEIRQKNKARNFCLFGIMVVSCCSVYYRSMSKVFVSLSPFDAFFTCTQKVCKYE